MKHSIPATGVLEFLNRIAPASDWISKTNLLEKYAELLLQHAERRNLLSDSQRNLDSVWSHIFDSLQPLALGLLNQDKMLIDAGSGGGLPGVPLAIACPDRKVLLIERSNSKVEFLELARALIPLSNVEVRCEELKSVLRRPSTDSVILARALTQPSKWTSLLSGTYGKSAWIIFATEHNQEDWTDAASDAHLQLSASHEYHLPGSTAKRILLQFA